MVLAKIDDGQGVTPGTRGISLFLVPKYLVNPDGSLGAHNGVKISGINHKMGQRGIVNTVPVLGADAPCKGVLLGEPGKGMAAMFHMMNEARIGIGMTAAQYGYFGYRYSLGYAKDRVQGRTIRGSDPAKPQIPIIEHTDVKRMLLQQKALTEGAMALCFYAAQLVDRSRGATDEVERHEHEQLLAILTPIVKSWPSVWGLHANYLAIQVLGGYGYTRDFPVERLYRDNRLNEIHEGTTGIQSLDLLGRKVVQDGGSALKLMLAEMTDTASRAEDAEPLREYSVALRQAIDRIESTTASLIGEYSAGRTERFLANSVIYLEMCGHSVVAWMWLRMALAAQKELAEGHSGDESFLKGKLRACRYFYRFELPKTIAQADLLQSLDDTCLTACAEDF
jgi:butyryl-CoA dehydrogenase